VRDVSPTFVDLFSGCGGTALGMTEAGWQLEIAINHWRPAVDSHMANFPTAIHKCADINNYDMRRLPLADMLVASPICTEASPAGANPGVKYVQIAGQTALDSEGEPIEQAGYERTRATFYDVLRAVEVGLHKIVIIENVVDVAWKWLLYAWFLQAMVLLGYNLQIVCVSCAHIGDELNPHAAQWRDRKFLIFTRKGVPLPNVAPSPPAYCEKCDQVVNAVQWWKPGTRRFLGQPVGKYRQQYLYQCPRQHAFVEPFVRPAASIIDWDDLGERLGDRKRLPVEGTLRRIRAGMELIREPALITLNHADGQHRAVPLHGAPLWTRTTKVGEGIATHPDLPPPAPQTAINMPAFIVEMRNHQTARPISEPITTVTTSGRHHYLAVAPDGRDLRVDPRTLVVPYQRRARGGRDASPAARGDIRIEDVYFRMLNMAEHKRAQRFPDTYVIKGNRDQKAMQIGNAVPVNVAHWLGRQAMEVLR
jgi:DNA (cytosine-5)-methyltransferase 1